MGNSDKGMIFRFKGFTEAGEAEEVGGEKMGYSFLLN